MILKTGKDFSDELINLYEDTTTLIGVDTIKAMFDSEKGKGISFDDIIKVSAHYSDYSKDALIEFWVRIIQIANSKHDRSTIPTAKQWQSKLENAFYKTYLAEKAIVEKLATEIPSLGLSFNADDHSFFYETMGEDSADFKSKLGTIECKSESAKRSNDHDAKLLLIYRVDSTNVTSTGNIEGSFYITQPYKSYKSKDSRHEEAKNFITALKTSNRNSLIDSTKSEKPIINNEMTITPYTDEVVGETWSEIYDKIQNWPEVERNKLLKLIITTEPKYTEPVGDTFTIPAAQYTINFKSYNDYKKEIRSQLATNKEAKAKELARASGKTSDELKAEYKKASLKARDAFNILKNKELNYYINKDNPSNSVPPSWRTAQKTLDDAIDTKNELAYQLSDTDLKAVKNELANTNTTTTNTSYRVKENYNMIKTDFMKLYENLSTLNEDAKTDASKEFWRLAKENILSVEDFHTAYDEELVDFGRVYLFNRYTQLLNDKSTYGKIKKLVAENPSNWAIKALLKFWVLQFSTNAKTKEEVDKEKARAELNATFVKKYEEWTPSVLAELDQDLVKKYLEAWKIKAEDITYSTWDYYEHGQWHERKVTLLPSKWSWSWSIKGADEPKREDLVKGLTNDALKYEIEKAEREEWTRQYTEKQKSNAVIDVFKNNSCQNCHVIVEGESGKLYYVRSGSSSYEVKSLSKNVGKEIIDAHFLCNVPESYKVVYTECSSRDSSSMMRTYSSRYYSWDSSNAVACKLAPEVGSSSDPYSDSTVKKISSGDGKNYSLMDNIDSWAYRSTVDYNYD